MPLESSADFDPRDPIRASEPAGLHEERRTGRSSYLGPGSLACPRCDAPVALGTTRATPADPLCCPFCDHGGPLHEFLSLTPPLRAPRVHVLVRQPDGH